MASEDSGKEAPLSAPWPPAPGQLVAGKYRVEKVLGEGGMGVVVAARHEQLGERVAIKFASPASRAVPGAAGRFLREARALARIKSEHAVRVSDVGELPSGEPYMVMEHLVGSDLAAHLEERRALPLGEAVDAVVQACAALAEAHALGIVHRDLKPSNLFLTRRSDGSALVKVLDFGVAKSLAEDSGPAMVRTATGAIMGSPQYMSPEQVRASKSIDARSDIWSLGVVLYELVAGQPPFLAETAPALCAKIIADPPTPLGDFVPDVPPSFEAIVMRCLDKDPARRFADVAALAGALEPFLGHAARASMPRVARTVEPGALDQTVPSDALPGVPVSVRAVATASTTLAAPTPRSARWPLLVGLSAVALVAVVLGVSAREGGDTVPAPTLAAPAPSLGASATTAGSITPEPRVEPVVEPSASASAALPAGATRPPAPRPIATQRPSVTPAPTPSAPAPTPPATAPVATATTTPKVDPLGDRK